MSSLELFNTNKSSCWCNRCFSCGSLAHFARNYPGRFSEFLCIYIISFLTFKTTFLFALNNQVCSLVTKSCFYPFRFPFFSFLKCVFLPTLPIAKLPDVVVLYPSLLCLWTGYSGLLRSGDYLSVFSPLLVRLFGTRGGCLS